MPVLASCSCCIGRVLIVIIIIITTIIIISIIMIMITIMIMIISIHVVAFMLLFLVSRIKGGDKHVRLWGELVGFTNYVQISLLLA